MNFFFCHDSALKDLLFLTVRGAMDICCLCAYVLYFYRSISAQWVMWWKHAGVLYFLCAQWYADACDYSGPIPSIGCTHILMPFYLMDADL